MSDVVVILVYVVMPAIGGGLLGVFGTLYVKRKLKERRERRETALQKLFPEGTRFRVRTADAWIEGHLIPEDAIIHRVNNRWIVENQLDGSRHQLLNVEDRHIRLAHERWILRRLFGTAKSTIGMSGGKTSPTLIVRKVPQSQVRPGLAPKGGGPRMRAKSRIDIICENIDDKG